MTSKNYKKTMEFKSEKKLTLNKYYLQKEHLYKQF